MNTNSNPSLPPFFFAETSIYREKLKGENPGKIGGANAPPTDTR